MTNTPFLPLASLECLSRIFPIQGAIIIGAGMGRGPWFELFQQQNIENVLLIEADEAHARHLEKKYANHTSWSILQHVVGDLDGKSTFYRLSNSAESSLLPLETLRGLWPNISINEERSCLTVKLDTLLTETASNVNWLIVDALPALPMLNGGLGTLEAIEVIIIRQITDAHVRDAMLQGTEDFMQEHGFTCFGSEPELHPSFEHAVYVKETRKQSYELKLIKKHSEKLQKELAEKQAVSKQEKNELLQSIEKAKQDIDDREQHIEELMKSVDALEKELDTSKQAKIEIVEHLQKEAGQKEGEWVKKQAIWEQEKSELLKGKGNVEQQAAAKQQRIEELTQNAKALKRELAERKKDFSSAVLSKAIEEINARLPLDKGLALNRAYRIEWKNYLDRLSTSEINKKISSLESGMDRESSEILRLQLSLIESTYPGPITDYLLVDMQAKKKLLPEATREHFSNIGYFEDIGEKLSILQRELDLDEEPLPELLFGSGIYYIMELAKNKLRGAQIIDAGAYIGDTAKMFYNTFEPEKIWALEPQPSTFQRLVNNINRWKAEGRIIPLKLGIAETAMDIQVWGNGLGASTIRKIPSGKIDRNICNALSIDELVSKYSMSRIGLIKLDVEGLELEGLKGAVQTIKKFSPILIVSIYHTAKDFFEAKPFLESLGLGYKFIIRKTTDDLIKEFVLIAFSEV